MKRKVLALCLALCLLLGTCLSASPVMAAGENEYQMVAEELEVLKIVNLERSAQGLDPLTSLPLLQSACDIRTEEISQLFSHTRPNGYTCFSVVLDVGLDDFGLFGENIAAGYATAEDVMYGWMHSDGHRSNILNDTYRHIGIGHGVISERSYWVQFFCKYYDCTYTHMELLSPEGQTFPLGTEAEDMGLVAKLTCQGCGESYLPVLNEYCSGFDSQTEGQQTLTVSCLGLTATIDITTELATEGQCGDNAYWHYDETTKTLTVSGTGNMWNYSWEDSRGWDPIQESIVSVEIDAGITSVGSRAFKDFKNLTSVTLSDSVTSIGPWAFYNCYSLTGITIPNSVTIIWDFAFDNCKSLTRITVPKGVRSIGSQAFASCTGLTSVTIPDSVTSIGLYAFMYCTDLEGIWVDSNNPRYSSDSRGVLFNKNKTTLIQAPGAMTGIYTIPDSVTAMEDYAFYACFDLTGVKIPSRMTNIGERAFCCCFSLNGITIPDSVTGIGDYAFEGCRSLSTAIIGGGVASIGDSAFSGCKDLTSIYFLGDAPIFASSEYGEPDIFGNVTAKVYYPEGNPTWSSSVMQDYGGNLSWIPFEPVPFSDVSVNQYFYMPVMWAYENGITTGVTATTFEPNKDCTRGQVVTFLWRAAGQPEPTLTENPFADVSEDAFYYKAILWAVEKGITTGATATTFNPKGACTRAQVVSFLWRAAGKPAPTSQENPFSDVEDNRYYTDAVLWAVENGITTGINQTKFAPNSTCTRGQIVTFLYRVYAG